MISYLHHRFVVAALLLAGTFACLLTNAQDLPADLIPTFQIPKTDQPPTIDGVIDAAEWQQAVAIGGTVDATTRRLVGRPDTFYLSWDEGHLYLAAKVWMDGEYERPVIREGRAEGLAYVFDDGLELNLMPLGKNVPVGSTRSSYKWFLNALGFGGDYSRNSVGQQFKNWGPTFTVATHLTKPGSAPNGGRWWMVELSSTPEDFELNGPHRAGDEWRMLLAVNHFTAGWSQAAIPINGPYLNSDGHARAVLSDGRPAVQMTMPDWTNLRSGGVMHRLVRAYNPGSKPVELTVEYGVLESEVKGSESLQVPPGESAALQIQEALPEALTEGTAYLRVKQGEESLYTYGALFKVGEARQSLGVRATPKGAFPLEARYNPVAGTLLIKADTYYLPAEPAPRRLRYTLTRQESGEQVTEGEVTNLSLWYMQDVIQLPELAPGDYAVTVSLDLADGQTLGPIESSFEKKDEAAEFAEWWDKPYDDIRRVIPPFTAMTRADAKVGVWGREIELGALGLPRTIASQDAPVMAAPARVVLVIDGQEQVLDITAADTSLEFTETEAYRVSFRSNATLAGVALSAEGWIEQDGLCYVELTYAPGAGTEALQIDALRLEFPLAEADAETLYCVGPGENYSSRTTMILPPEQQGRLWSTHITGGKASQMAVGSFYPQVWIGNDRRGLLWWADNDEGWVPTNAHPAHSVSRRDGAIVLTNHLISEPYRLDHARTVRFSYNASPFRPLVKGWRHFIATQDGTFFQPHRKTRKDSKTGKPVNPGHGHVNWIHPESRYPEEWDALWAEQKAKADRRVLPNRASDPYEARSGIHFGHISFQVMRYGRKTAQSELYKYFGHEWEANEETFNSSFRRYCLWLFERGFRDGGYYTTYWDLNFPIHFDNVQSGLAYTLPDGRVQPGYNGWNLRRFYMGLYALADQYDLAPGAIGVHSTNSYILVSQAWNDAVLDGEYGFLRDGAERDWVDQFPIERMRTLSVSHNWGSAVGWMDLIKFTDKAKVHATTESAIEYIWLYDSWRNPYMEPFTKMPESVLDWGLNEEEVVYHPFWRNPFVSVVSDQEDILVSLWQWDDRIMLNVYNYNREKSRHAELEIDLAALGLVPELPWQQAVQVRALRQDADAPQPKFNANTGTLLLQQLAPHSGRLIGIRLY